MAYAEEYYSEFKSYNDTFTGRVEIHSDGFVGSSTEITVPAANPVTISRRGHEDNKDDVIVGSELVFTFIVLPSDSDKYDVLFTADYKKHKIIYKEDSVTKWTGYLQPENMDREWLGSHYEIKLSATDGLADLKDIDYLNSGVVYTDRVSILTVIKRCLDEVGFSLDFKVQLGTYENTAMLSTDCALDKVTIDNRRFIKINDGRQTAETCYNVITELLKIWKCLLMQSNNNYWIISEHEYNTYVHTFTYSTLAKTGRVASDLRVDASTYDHVDTGTLTKVSPVKKTGITFRNRNLGDTLFGGGTTWGSSEFETVTYTSPDTLFLGTTAETAGTELAVESSNISVTKISDEDKLALSFTVSINAVVPTGTGVDIKVQIYNPDTAQYVTVRTNEVIGTLSKRYNLSTPITGSGNYKVKFIFIPYDNITSMSIDIELMSLYAVYSGSDVTFDQYMEAVNSSPAGNKVYEDTIIFGDTNQDSDVGALKISGTRTDLWRRYGTTDDKALLELYAFQNLISYQRWKNYLKVRLYDASRNLLPHNYILHDSVVYRWVSVHYNAIEKVWDGQLIEVLTADVTYTGSPSALSTVDGESSGESTGAIIPAGSAFEPAFSKNTGFNKNLGTTAGTVAEGNHNHTGVYLPLSGGTVTGNLQVNGELRVDATRGLTDVTGSYGTVQTVGTGIGGWSGYNISGRVAMAHDHASAFGILDDVNNQWIMYATLLGKTSLYYNGAEKIQTTNTGISVTGDVIATGETEAYDTSDRRLKKNITPISTTLDHFEKLNPVRFYHKRKKKNDIGLIAQEVKELFPEVVKEDDKGFLMVHYGKLVTVCIKAILELIKRVKKLENGRACE